MYVNTIKMRNMLHFYTKNNYITIIIKF